MEARNERGTKKNSSAKRSILVTLTFPGGGTSSLQEIWTAIRREFAKRGH